MNKKIVVATLIIGGSGVVNGMVNGKPITPVIVGSYIFLLLMSVLDMFGGPLSALAGGLALVATVFVIINEFPWGTVLKTVKGK